MEGGSKFIVVYSSEVLVTLSSKAGFPQPFDENLIINISIVALNKWDSTLNRNKIEIAIILLLL